MSSNQNGLFIAIEGGDSSGKATQTRLLGEELEKITGQTATIFSFPRYEETLAAKLCRDITRGRYGDPLFLHPKIASLSFVLDRLLIGADLKRALSLGHVICDRYTPSNLVYQAAKLWPDLLAQDEFIAWLEHLEYKECGLPKPDLVLFLDVSPPVARRLLFGRGQELDRHEESQAYQERVYQTYWRLSRERESWKVIRCLSSVGDMRPSAEIHKDIARVILDHYLLLVEDE